MKTASKYEIRDIAGSTYLFFEWKSGDYTIRHMKPYYYVLKFKTAENTITDMSTLERVEDDIDLPFVDDPDVIGTWECVDFVREISDFDPYNRYWANDLIFRKVAFWENGKVDMGYCTWTKGVVMDPGNKTASKYEIKEIDGSTYMFFEWKSGDYTIRHMKPCYYVFKKIS
jgi:bla regulator protein BlaR1